MATGIAAGLGAGAFWGTVFVSPLVAPDYSSEDHTGWRFIVCGVFSLVLMLWHSIRATPLSRAKVWPNLRQASQALGLSVLGYGGYFLLLAYAIEDAGSALAALVIGTIPVWMMLLGKPQHLRWSALWPGLLLTVVGMVLMMEATAREVRVTGDGSFWRGFVFAVGAMLSWLAFGLRNARWVQNHPEVSSTAWANWLGVAAGLGGVLIWLGWGTPWHELIARPGLASFVAVCLITGIGSAWIASVLWNIASRRLSTSLAGQLVVSETVFALVYSYSWKAQWPPTGQLVACVLFIAGVLASIRSHR